MPDLGRALERSTEAATAALAKLTAGFTADDLVRALNLMVVHCDTDSANISADSRENPQQGRGCDQTGARRYPHRDWRQHRQHRRGCCKPEAV
jgi:hypothetical protein